MQLYDTPEVEELEEIDLDQELEDTGVGNHAQLIVFNDDVNSFEWVIKSFTKILNHTDEQAEQLAMLIHFKGKATVKTAPFSVLKPLKEGLTDRGLSAIIEGKDEG